MFETCLGEGLTEARKRGRAKYNHSLLWFSTVTARAWQAKRFGAGIVDGGDHDRYWHKADMQTAPMNVRFGGNNRHEADVTRCPLMTHSGHSEPKIHELLQLDSEAWRSCASRRGRCITRAGLRCD